MARTLRNTGRVMGLGAGALALLGVSYVGVTWYRYGKVGRSGRRDPLLDQFMPRYEVRETHETEVAAPADVTYRVAHEIDLHRSTIVRAMFTGRELLMGAERVKQEHPPGFLAEVLALGWRILAEEPGHQLVMGAVTQPWQANVVFRGLPPEDFAAFSEPGYAKIVWNFAVEPLGDSRSKFRTETRVVTTDPDARRRFRRYWSVVSPGVLLIRYETLRLVRHEAERQGGAERHAVVQEALPTVRVKRRGREEGPPLHVPAQPAGAPVPESPQSAAETRPRPAGAQ